MNNTSFESIPTNADGTNLRELLLNDTRKHQSVHVRSRNMKRERKFPPGISGLCLCLWGIGLALLGGCSGGSNEAEAPRKAALQALVSVREMATESDFEFFGYKSQGDVGTEQLGDALPVRVLDVDALLSNATPTEALIIDRQEVLFPVLVGAESVSSLRVGRKNDGSWTLLATEADASDIDLALQTIQSHSFDKASCYLLDLPEIELLMLGCRRSGALRLVPLYTPSAEFGIDTEYPFADIIDAIKAEVLAARDSPVEPDVDVQPVLKAQRPPVAARAAQDSATHKSLPITLVAQEQSQWCWTAAAQMTMRFASGGAAEIPSQCSQANKAQGDARFLNGRARQDCCANGHANAADKPCNTPWFPEYVNWGFTRTRTEGAPTWDDLKSLIDRGQALAFLWKWKIGGGHYMVVVGYKETSNNKFIEYLDPFPVGEGSRTTVTYDAWVGGDDNIYRHRFGVYFTDITPQQ
jgi:hypothetical protein